MPVPVRGTVVGEVGSELVMVRVPGREPVMAGVKVMVTVQVWAGARVAVAQGDGDGVIAGDGEGEGRDGGGAGIGDRRRERLSEEPMPTLPKARVGWGELEVGLEAGAGEGGE